MEKCRWCGVFHGPLCPAVKAIEYFECGSIKRVEFKTAGDYAVPIPVSGLLPPIVLPDAPSR